MIPIRPLSAHCAALLIQWEGERLTAYQDQGGVWTIGVGHTGADVHAGLTITQARSRELFEADTAWARKCVQDACPDELTDNQFGALVSCCFNIGADAFRHSTVCKVANGQSQTRMRDALLMWVNVNHRPNAGLINRRNHEADLWEEV